MQRYGGAVLLALLIAGCGFFKTERSSEHPLQFMRKDADAIVELRDIGMFAALRSSLSQQFSGVFSDAEIGQMREELSLLLGFDPTSLKGLASVGLAIEGPIAGEVLADGTGAVWAIPVDKPKTLAPVIKTVMEARFGVDEVVTETQDGVALTRMLMEFGPRKVQRAAHAMAKGHIIIAFGPKSDELVLRAVKNPKAESALTDPSYRAMAKRVGETYDARFVSMRGAEALTSALRRIDRRAAELKSLTDRVSQAGWTLRYHEGAIKADGHAVLDDAGQKQVQEVFAVKGGVPAGVKAVNLDRAIVFVQASGNPEALLQTIAPEGSGPRRQLDRAVARVKQDLDIDLLKDILPKFSGHAALAVGTGDLSGVEFKEIVGNPAGLTWTAFAASARDPKALAAAEGKLNTKLKERNVEVKKRTLAGAELREVMPIKPDGETADALFSTFSSQGAWGFSVEPVVAEAIVKNSGAQDALDGRPGVYGELRVERLSAELRRFNIRELPILYRALVVKMLDYLSLVQVIQGRVEPSRDGLHMQGELRFSKRVTKSS